MHISRFVRMEIRIFCVIFCFQFLGCTAQQPSLSSTNENADPIEMPIPNPVVPADWPKTVILHDKSGLKTEYDSKTLYDANYIRGWNECIYQYAAEFSGDLDLVFSCQTGYERTADWKGNADCTLILEQFEQKHGREKLIQYLRDNSHLYW